MVYFLVYFFILLSGGRRGGIKLKGRKGRKGRKEGKEGSGKKCSLNSLYFGYCSGLKTEIPKMVFKSPYGFSTRRYEHGGTNCVSLVSGVREAGLQAAWKVGLQVVSRGVCRCFRGIFVVFMS